MKELDKLAGELIDENELDSVSGGRGDRRNFKPVMHMAAAPDAVKKLSAQMMRMECTSCHKIFEGDVSKDAVKCTYCGATIVDRRCSER